MRWTLPLLLFYLAACGAREGSDAAALNGDLGNGPWVAACDAGLENGAAANGFEPEVSMCAPGDARSILAP